jgi:hypothetical protein
MFRSLAAVACLTIFASCQGGRSPTFAEFVDQYLDDFARRHPSIAAGDGLHQHDDRLDDFTATGIAEEIAALKRDAATLAAFDTTSLTADERVDLPSLPASSTDGCWSRKPCRTGSGIRCCTPRRFPTAFIT